MTEFLSSNTAIIGDVVVVIVILVFAFVAAGRGFLKCIVGFLGTVLSIVLAFLFCKNVSVYLQDWFGLLDKFTDFFRDAFSKINGFDIDISGNMAGSLGESNLPAFILSIITKAFVDKEIPVGTTIADLLSPVVSQMLLLIISFLIIYILVKIIAAILNGTVSELATKIPVIRSLNGLFGFLLGLLEGFMTVFAILYVCSLLPFSQITDYISSTTIIKSLYNNNWIGYITNWIISSDWLYDYIISKISA